MENSPPVNFDLVAAIAFGVAVLALLARFALRWPWSLAILTAIVLVLSGFLPYTLIGVAEKITVTMTAAIVEIVWLHRWRNVPLVRAILWGGAVFIVLGILILPIHTHAVKLDMPR